MMYDKAQCKILFQIIRVSLFDSDEFEINAEADWKLIYRISREHKIHTILCRGLEKISSKDKIPEKKKNCGRSRGQKMLCRSTPLMRYWMHLKRIR